MDVVIAAYLREGLQVETDLRSASFARLDVRSAAESAKVELGLDRRKNEPIRLAAGPVLHADDAVANKICALFGRAWVMPAFFRPGPFRDYTGQASRFHCAASHSRSVSSVSRASRSRAKSVSAFAMTSV